MKPSKNVEATLTNWTSVDFKTLFAAKKPQTLTSDKWHNLQQSFDSLATEGLGPKGNRSTSPLELEREPVRRSFGRSLFRRFTFSKAEKDMDQLMNSILECYDSQRDDGNPLATGNPSTNGVQVSEPEPSFVTLPVKPKTRDTKEHKGRTGLGRARSIRPLFVSSGSPRLLLWSSIGSGSPPSPKKDPTSLFSSLPIKSAASTPASTTEANRTKVSRLKRILKWWRDANRPLAELSKHPSVPTNIVHGKNIADDENRESSLDSSNKMDTNRLAEAIIKPRKSYKASDEIIYIANTMLKPKHTLDRIKSLRGYISPRRSFRRHSPRH